MLVVNVGCCQRVIDVIASLLFISLASVVAAVAIVLESPRANNINFCRDRNIIYPNKMVKSRYAKRARAMLLTLI